MNDRELLEFAAKAAGIELEEYRQDWRDDNGNPRDAWRTVDRVLFNPLADDGDALRLAVKLAVYMDCSDGQADVMILQNLEPTIRCIEPHGDDPCAATRRAIVKVAAEIGKAMQG